MKKDILFRGCTRPAMLFGVPYIPLSVTLGVGLWLAMAVNLFFLILVPISMYIMQQMTKRDDMIFRLLGLRLQFMLRAKQRDEFKGMWCFSPNSYRPHESTNIHRARRIYSNKTPEPQEQLDE